MANNRITIGSNPLSYGAQRRLAQNSLRLENSLTRLASGARINKASDDAAGLAIASRLNSDARVFQQGIRNLNDGISYLNVAEGALGELGNLLTRQRELATQAANGTYSALQRASMETEANTLVREYNRIVESTQFNGRSVLSADQGTLHLQSEYGSDGVISTTIAQELARDAGNGTFQAQQSFSTGGQYVFSIGKGDFDGDGTIDVVTAGDARATILLGNGDGTFRTPSSYGIGSGNYYINTGDLNGDSKTDIFVSDYDEGTISVLVGNGNGTFQAVRSYQSGGARPNQAQIADLNGDGTQDMVVSLFTGNSVGVLLGNGDGSFIAPVTSATITTARSVIINDVNQDGEFDLLITENDGYVDLLIGNGNGTFQAKTTIVAASGFIGAVTLGDFNEDGNDDLVVGDTQNGYGSILFGNGNGTFLARTTIAVGATPENLLSLDFDEDGDLDLVLTNESDSTLSVLLNNGDGTFAARQTQATLGGSFALLADDFDNNGTVDLVTGNAAQNSIQFFSANTRLETRIAELSFATQADVQESIRTLDTAMNRVRSELGVIGASQSRIATAVANLSARNENIRTAESRISDVDVASESAELIRLNILQQVGSAVLAQANQIPALAIRLLGGG